MPVTVSPSQTLNCHIGCFVQTTVHNPNKDMKQRNAANPSCWWCCMQKICWVFLRSKIVLIDFFNFSCNSCNSLQVIVNQSLLFDKYWMQSCVLFTAASGQNKSVALIQESPCLLSHLVIMWRCLYLDAFWARKDGGKRALNQALHK